MCVEENYLLYTFDTLYKHMFSVCIILFALTSLNSWSNRDVHYILKYRLSTLFVVGKTLCRASIV